MKKETQIIAIHLGVQVLYSTLFMVFCYAQGLEEEFFRFYTWLGFMVTQAFFMIGHGITIAILASNQPKDKPEYAQAHWLSLGFVFLLGGSICFVAPEVFVDRFY